MPVRGSEEWLMVTNHNAGLLLGVCMHCLCRQLRNLPDHLVNTVQFLLACFCRCLLIPARSFPIHTMTPIWIFPGYPLLIVAPFAANLIDALPDAAAASRVNSIAIAFGAICVQGIGFLVSLMIYAAFIYRLMTQKLPREKTRPGMVCLSYCVQLGRTNSISLFLLVHPASP